jgi:sugar O-acyltransferase (sialic acid O-acetyltransferase NeuD family)
MSDKPRVFVFGASGHAKVVIDAIERGGRYDVAFLCDDAPEKHGSKVMGYTIARGREELLARRNETSLGIVAIGANAVRLQIAQWLAGHGCRFLTAVHPQAVIAREVEIAEGTVVMAGCIVNSGARIGAHAIVNTGASVDHDCALAEGVHIGPGAHLCGHVSIGAGTLIGAGTTIVPSVRVGANAVVGAGSTVLADVPDGARVGGTPCRPLAA